MSTWGQVQAFERTAQRTVAYIGTVVGLHKEERKWLLIQYICTMKVAIKIMRKRRRVRQDNGETVRAFLHMYPRYTALHKTLHCAPCAYANN